LGIVEFHAVNANMSFYKRLKIVCLGYAEKKIIISLPLIKYIQRNLNLKIGILVKGGESLAIGVYIYALRISLKVALISRLHLSPIYDFVPDDLGFAFLVTADFVN